MLIRVFLITLFFILSQISACRKTSSYPVNIDTLSVGTWKILTPHATYYFDEYTGAFQSMADPDGIDWIRFISDSLPEYPQSAAASYRGIPNLIYGSADHGAGHPGYANCYSKPEAGNRIRTKTKSGRWEWTWSFYRDYAELEILRADPDHKYWFLYEGPVAGRFDPPNYYWGTSQGGPHYNIPDYFQGEYVTGNFQWMYFGHRNLDRILYLAQAETDDSADMISFLGCSREGLRSTDGMVVAGFGRKSPATPLLTTTGNRFLIGFYEKKIESAADHAVLRKYIEELINR